MSRRLKTTITWLLILLIMTGLAFFLLAFYFNLSGLILFFIAANLVTLFLFGWDKIAAGQKIDRVPETVLYFSVFFGGGVGALLGMNIFRHKTQKSSFQLVVALIILIQLIALVFLNQFF